MSSYHEAVKLLLAEVNKFLNTTLKSESLSKSAQKKKTKVIELLQKLFADYDSLAPNTGDEGSTSSSTKGQNLSTSTDFDDSRNTGGSSHGSEEDGYSDNISDATVKTLTNPIKIGFLEKRQKDLLRTSWQKRYCVLHRNTLYLFKKPADKKQQNAFFVTGYELREAPQNVKDAAKKDYSFELVCPGKATHQFLADSKQDLESWREAIVKASGPMSPAGIGEEGQNDDIYEEFTNTPTTEELYTDGTTEPTPVSPSPSVISAKSVPPKTDQNQNAVQGDEVYEDVAALSPEPDSGKPIQSAAMGPKSLNKAKGDDAVPSLPSRGGGGNLPPVPSRSDGPPLPARGDDLPPLPARSSDALTSGGSDAPPPLPNRNAPLPPPPTNPLPPIPQEKKTISPSLGKILHPSEDFENLFFGAWACKGGSINELSFERGEIIHVISRDLDSQDWWVGALKGKVGLVPKSYLTPAWELLP